VNVVVIYDVVQDVIIISLTSVVVLTTVVVIEEVGPGTV
jgi:hypothetical protein